MEWYKKITDLLIYSKLWIALGAVAMLAETYLLWGLPILWDATMGLVFVSTIATYLLARLFAWHRMSAESRAKAWLQGQDKWLALGLLGSSLIGAYLFFQVNFGVQVALIASGVITLLYSLPVLRKKGEWVKLRDFDFVKIFLIAFIWWLSSVWLAYLNLPEPMLPLVETWQVIGVSVERCLFIFAITLPFDIRDLQYDKAKGLRTIPQVLGKHRSLQICYTLLIGLVLLAVGQYGVAQGKWAITGALSISYLSTLWLISHANEHRPDQFYTGYLDGTMILQFLLLMIIYSCYT